MASASEGRSWTLNAEERLLGLEIVLLKSTYVLPWSQFLYAEGTSDEVRAVFTTHDIWVKGSGLASLPSDFAVQQISVCQSPLALTNSPTRPGRAFWS